MDARDVRHMGAQSQHFPRLGGVRSVRALSRGAVADGVARPPRVRDGRNFAKEVVHRQWMDRIHAAGGLDGVRAVRDVGCSARGAAIADVGGL